MSTTVRSKEMMSRSKVITLGACAAALAAAVTGVVMIASLNGKEYTAKTMRLLRAEGTVNLEDASGATLPAMDNVRFKSGDALSTGSDGTASVGLDESKVVTLREDSRAEFVKSRKSMELSLTQGELYFNVKEHLADDETFDIRTSTMSVGIRGTSGYVYYDEEGRQNVLITDGCVHVEATNPVTGEVGQIDVSGGHCATLYTYDDKETDSVEFEMTEVSIDDLPDFVLETIANDEELLGRVCDYNGWNADELVEAAASVDSSSEKDQLTQETEPTATPAPTAEPTVEATPTAKPTAAPTRAPRRNTTPTPTAVPTAAPTATPTAKPTGKPAAPTATPTPVPNNNSNSSSSSDSSSEPAETTVPTETTAPTAAPAPAETTVAETVQPTEQTEPTQNTEPSAVETAETVDTEPTDITPAPQDETPADTYEEEVGEPVYFVDIPNITEEDLPMGYEMWLWDEANGRFMMVGNNQDTHEFEQLGYVSGEWVALQEKDYQGADGYTMDAYYLVQPNGDETLYCTREDMQNCATNFYDIMAARRQAAAEQAAAEQAAAEQQAAEQSSEVSSARDLNHNDDGISRATYGVY